MRSSRLAVATALLLAAPCAALSCGDDMYRPVLVHLLRPDAPFEPYARGRLGILQPSFAYSYLVVAHRYLDGGDFDAEEQKAVLGVWNGRMRVGLAGERPYTPGPVEQWRRARLELSGFPPAIKLDQVYAYRGYRGYRNCTDDAFVNALKTLEARTITYGPSNPSLRAWVEGQDRVFANCSGQEAWLPGLPRHGAGSLEQADWAYQVAAALFYAGKFKLAELAFRVISQDPSSPWQGIAPYLAVRAIVRQAQLFDESDSTRREALGQAVAELEALLADPKHAGIHRICRRLLGYVKRWFDPPGRLLELARELRKQGSPTLKQDLWDFSILIGKLVQGPPRWGGRDDNARSLAARMEALAAGDELTDWVLTFKHGNGAYAVERWEATGSPAWFVAAISKLEATHPAVGKLLRAAEAIPPSSPGALTVAYHVTRLQAALGRRAEARAVVDDALSRDVASYSRSSYNLLMDQRALLATGLDDLLKHLARFAAGNAGESMDLSYDRAPSSPQLGMQGLGLLNRLPLHRLVQAIGSPSLEASLRHRVATAVWVRALVLSDDEMLVAATRHLRTLGTDLELEAVAASSDADARRHAAIMALLERPHGPEVLETDPGSPVWATSNRPYHGGWWRPVRESDDQRGNAFPEFLSQGERDQAQAEWAAVLAAGSGPRFFLERAIEFANEREDDPRVPRALHLSVASSRWAGGDKGRLGEVSRRAFRILHSRYPRSPWTRRTKYWYDGGW